MTAADQLELPAAFSSPELPDKLFFTIREVSRICEVEPHVLRYWETEFHQIRPVKKSGNRRFYRQRDIMAVLRIKHLLYEQHFTIRGARKRLQERGVLDTAPQNPLHEELTALRAELQAVYELLDTGDGEADS